MTITEARSLGESAYLAGKGQAPALNPEFLHQAAESGNLGELAVSYSRGWESAKQTYSFLNFRNF